MSDVKNSTESKELESDFVNFLEKMPPGKLVKISDLGSLDNPVPYLNGNARLNISDIKLHCNQESCDGIRFFRCLDRNNKYPPTDGYDNIYITYQCSNCQKTTKTYSLACQLIEDEAVNIHQPGYKIGYAYKFGELPVFGPQLSSRLLKMVGSDRSYFLKGRTCENQGLGIAAFAYYRRVVENQKNRILSEIIKVVEKISNEKEIVDQLKQAINETQFTKSLTIAKGAIPQSLLINGQNPLLLLHSALSDGIHGHSDEECLELAISVRIVLSELSERLSQALKDDTEVSKALQTLINKRAGK